MSVTQRYWLTFAPGLILAGFLGGLSVFCAFFIPSYFGYYAHRKEWTLSQFAIRATVFAFALFMFFCLTSQ